MIRKSSFLSISLVLLLTWPFSAFPQQAKLFELLSSDRTGIDFANLVEDNDSMNIISHPNHWNGGGVAIGDFDNDGLPDIYFSGNTVPDRVYKNLGELRFQDITETAGVNGSGGWRTGVSLVDINNDGWMDIYVCRAGPSYVNDDKRRNLLYINNGDLTFSERAKEYGVDDAGFSIHAVFFDMDNDGDEDLFVINNNHELSYGSNIYSKRFDANGLNRLYRNEERFFTNVSEEMGIESVNALSLNAVAADLNSDGYKDLYVSNDLVNSDQVFINRQGKSFQNLGREMFSHFSLNAMGCDVGDFNNDGLIDVFVVDMFPESAERQKNQAGITNDYFNSMVRQGHHPQYVRNTLFLNCGKGKFRDVAYMSGVAHTDWSWCPLFADFDNDGCLDLIVGNSLKRNILDNDFRVYKMDSLLRFGHGNIKHVLYKELEKTEALTLKNYIYKGSGALSFSDLTSEWGLDKPVNTTSISYGDLDNDGDLDLVYNNLDTMVSVFQNHTSQILASNYIRFKGSSGIKVSVYYQSKHQHQEFVGTRGYQSYPENVLHFGLGKCDLLDSVLVQFADRGRVVLTQVKTDTVISLQEQEFNLNAISPSDKEEDYGFSFEELESVLPSGFSDVQNVYDDFKREPLLYEKYSLTGPHTCKGDVNSDGLDDIYVSGSLGKPGHLFIQRLDGGFLESPQRVFYEDRNHEDSECVFIDVNSDGFDDLYVGSSGYELNASSDLLIDRLYLNNGSGVFSRGDSLIPQVRSNTSCVRLVEYKKNAEPALFVGSGFVPGRYPLSNANKLFEISNGILVEVSRIEDLPSIHVSDIVCEDFNQDGLNDLMVFGYWSPPWKLLNEGDKYRLDTSDDVSSSRYSGFWEVALAEDLDGDGDVDVIAGNRGTNTRLQCSNNQPITLYYDDFDDNGVVDPILSYYVQGEEAVIHSRDLLLDQMIGLRKVFLSYKQYARAKVPDIIGDSLFERTKKLEVLELQSGVFWNDGNGDFKFDSLCPELQLSPIKTIISEDFNLDGMNDLLVAGNSRSAHYSYGKDEAGTGLILVSGTTGSKFKTIPSRVSGLWLDGVITSIENIDDSGIYLFFRQNESVSTYQMNH